MIDISEVITPIGHGPMVIDINFIAAPMNTEYTIPYINEATPIIVHSKYYLIKY